MGVRRCPWFVPASFLTPDGRTTVRYADCHLLLAWPDGARQLIGPDAIVLHVEPTLFDVTPAATRLIDAAVPADRQITLPPRDPDEIPRPRAVRELHEYLARPKRPWCSRC
ncbi:hypothetical protein [Micromonospora radicis]|uniref:Uncharacterized protein n=1 Tax=Micromonospora radicis TaxID=1894971 RepID=A0A418MUU0_9ACTN|nr:hypothetical protein [Micromonospora radicis]RIV38049.1 hypothetical protein D2L64_14010 [Micromonospora radicis]